MVSYGAEKKPVNLVAQSLDYSNKKPGGLCLG